jgi:hypothetical protein
MLTVFCLLAFDVCFYGESQKKKYICIYKGYGKVSIEVYVIQRREES